MAAATATPAFVDAPPIRCLAYDGEGEPGSAPFQDAVRRLYSAAYRARFLLKAARGVAVKVPALEGIYDPPGVRRFTWTLLVPLPAELDDDTVHQAVDTGSGVRLEVIDEGRCAELLHVGPYADEAAALARLHAFIRESGSKPRGRLHEIYLN